MNAKSGTARTIVPPTEPEEAAPATKDKPGQNMRYGGEPVERTPPEPTPPEPPPETSWIEIELIDEADEPVPGARYEITASDGKVYDGSTGADGCARVEPIAVGTCQISFTKLDQHAWERA